MVFDWAVMQLGEDTKRYVAQFIPIGYIRCKSYLIGQREKRKAKNMDMKLKDYIFD